MSCTQIHSEFLKQIFLTGLLWVSLVLRAFCPSPVGLEVNIDGHCAPQSQAHQFGFGSFRVKIYLMNLHSYFAHDCLFKSMEFLWPGSEKTFRTSDK